MPLPRSVARFNRHATNRVLGPLAHFLPHFGVVIHRGRRSGREYRTPVNVFRRRGELLVALTYGPESDWVRNVEKSIQSVKWTMPRSDGVVGDSATLSRWRVAARRASIWRGGLTGRQASADLVRGTRCRRMSCTRLSRGRVPRARPGCKSGASRLLQMRQPFFELRFCIRRFSIHQAIVSRSTMRGMATAGAA